MTLTLPRTLPRAEGIAGPLLFVRAPGQAMLGEWVDVAVPGQPVRRGQVIDAGDELTVVLLLEDPRGVAPARSVVTLTGDLPELAVGKELLGRTLSGRGLPIDGLPEPVGDALVPLAGAPINPVRRLRPSDVIETGLTAIDGFNTLVRGQKLPVFSGPGLPALALAAQVVEQARAPKGEPFAVVFVGLGVTTRERKEFLERFESTGALERTLVVLNEARDPSVERILAPRVGLAAAEHLAYVDGLHVLVVMADLTHYGETLRELSTAREEIPGRRGYPGYLYTDLASLLERAGIIKDRPGSVTQLPVLTMPDDDITHPIPDLTGYITEGQVVLSRELARRGVVPPVDVLPSLSRLMNAGIGRDRTIPDHRAWADQLYACYSRGREARLMAAIVGEAGLSEPDRRALGFAERFEGELIHQGDRRRTFEETFAAGWSLLATLPRDDLTRLSDPVWTAEIRPRMR